MRIVIDTDVFVSSFFNPKGAPKKVIDLWKTEKAILCVTEEIIEEYVEVLMRVGLSGEPELAELLGLFKKKSNILFFASTPKLTLIQDDPDDNKFIECAVTAHARYIISGDKHLLGLNRYQDIQVLAPADLLNVKSLLAG